MGRLQTLVLLAIASAGCTTARTAKREIEQATHTVASAVGLEKPKPATELACAWSNRLSQLADPSHGHQMMPGVVGQVFLFTDELQAAEPNGDLTVSVSDATPRAPGQLPAKTEVYNFTAEVLKKLRVMDERYGMSIAVFLPWPAEWTDVKVLTIQARYDQKDGLTLTCQPSTVTIDFTSSNGATAGGAVTGSYRRLAPVPDPKAALAAMKTPLEVNGAWAAPMNPGQPVQPGISPPQPIVQPQQPAIPPPQNVNQPVQVQQPTAPPQDMRIVIPRR